MEIIEKAISFFSFNRKQKIIIGLIEFSKVKDKDEFTFSDFERYLGYKNPQPDLRELLKLFIGSVLEYHSNGRHGYPLYIFNKKEVINLEDSLEKTEYYSKFKKFYWR